MGAALGLLVSHLNRNGLWIQVKSSHVVALGILNTEGQLIDIVGELLGVSSGLENLRDVLFFRIGKGVLNNGVHGVKVTGLREVGLD